MLSFKSLFHLQSSQFLRGKSKGRLYVDICLILYLWIIEFVAFFILKDDEVTVPSLVIWIIAMSMLVPDFIYKLLLQHDNTVMNAFLKTRPVSQERWEMFLSISQFWRSSNLIMPLALAPMCFLFIPFLSGLSIFLTLYLLSVFGGFIVMLIKHRGTYESEKQVKNYMAAGIKSASGNFISGLQLRSVLRSKRLRGMGLYMSIFFYLECLIQSYDPKIGSLFIFMFILVMAFWLPQYGLSVEANFFNGIWSRPVNLKKILESKYLFGVICGLTAAVLCLPICIWSSTSVFDIVAYVLFSCFVILIMLIDAYRCVPLDLFGKTFFNYQGMQSTYKLSTFLVPVVGMIIGYVAILLLPGWKSQAILSSLGIIALCTYRPFFKHVVDKFMKNRYKYMEKYMSK